MDKLKELMSRCKCGVYLTVNQHRDSYESATKAFEDIGCANDDLSDIVPEVMAQMVARDTIIHLQFYPDTPIGSYSIYHYDLDAALDVALSCFPAPTGLKP